MSGKLHRGKAHTVVDTIGERRFSAQAFNAPYNLRDQEDLR